MLTSDTAPLFSVKVNFSEIGMRPIICFELAVLSRLMVLTKMFFFNQIELKMSDSGKTPLPQKQTFVQDVLFPGISLRYIFWKKLA